MEQNSRSFHNPLLSLARQRLRRRAVGASWGYGLTQARERQLPAQRPPGRHREGQAPHHCWRGWHRARSGQRWGVGWGSVSSFGTPQRRAPPPVDPARGQQAAGHAEAGVVKKGGKCSPQSRRELQPWREAWPLHGQRLSAPPGASQTTVQGPLPWTQGNRFMTIKAYSRHKKLANQAHSSPRAASMAWLS